jgi:glycerol-3-phosphate dehydrogenase (NAD(P)+)
MRVAVMGAGSFGTCLAILCAGAHDVTIWARDPEMAGEIDREHRNPRYLVDAPIPAKVRATSDLAAALAGAEIVICAVPSHGVRQAMAAAAPHLAADAIVVSTVKGIEIDTGLTMHSVIREALGGGPRRIVCLSGPSFAKEIAAGKPTSVTVASHDERDAEAAQRALSSPVMRCYRNTDVIGVELGGALKNVIAIAVGTGDGLGLGQNARAAVMTRGLAEITRLGVKMGANPITFLGLSGMGDLVLTCCGDLSRNRQVGLEIGKGRKLADILAGMREVAEGVRTTKAANLLATRHEVDMPIAAMVQEVFDGLLEPAQGVARLMTRSLKAEGV